MTTIDTAVVLAGGRGSRLMPETKDKPKAMVPVFKKPLVDWIIFWLKKNGIRTVVVSVDYKKEKLIDYLGNGRRYGLRIVTNVHTGAEETGDAFRSVLSNIKLPDTFLALNSDQITDLRILPLMRRHRKYAPIATIVTTPARMPYGIVEADRAHSITAFKEKPILKQVLMSTGIYVFHKSIAAYLPQKGAIEKTTFPRLVKEKKIRMYVHRGLFTTINTHKDLEEAEVTLRQSGHLL